MSTQKALNLLRTERDTAGKLMMTNKDNSFGDLSRYLNLLVSNSEKKMIHEDHGCTVSSKYNLTRQLITIGIVHKAEHFFK